MSLCAALLPLLLTASAAAESAPADAPAAATTTPTSSSARTVMLMDLEVKGADKKAVETFTGLLASELDRYPSLKVVSGNDLRRMLELEAERVALGCDTEVSASCLAEIAGALGADFVIYGEVAALGKSLVIQLNLADSAAANVLGRETLRAPDLDAASAQLPAAVGRLVAPLGLAPLSPAPAGPGALTYASFGVAAGGVGLAVVGAGLSLVGFVPLGLYNYYLTLAPTVRNDDHRAAVTSGTEAANFYNRTFGIAWIAGGLSAAALGVVVALASAGAGVGLVLTEGE